MVDVTNLPSSGQMWIQSPEQLLLSLTAYVFPSSLCPSVTVSGSYFSGLCSSALNSSDRHVDRQTADLQTETLRHRNRDRKTVKKTDKDIHGGYQYHKHLRDLTVFFTFLNCCFAALRTGIKKYTYFEDYNSVITVKNKYKCSLA